MYSPSEVSPPPSLSRPRPWSPDPTDPLPPSRSFDVRTSHGRTSATPPYPRHDASEPSVDALDLADYARTLNLHPFTGDPTYDDYLLPPPRSVSAASHASLIPPSLISSRGTPTSQSHSTPSPRHATRGAFSPSIPISSLSQPSIYNPPDNALYSPKILHASFDTTSSRGGVSNSEIDISQFPAWSRGWYAKDIKSKADPQLEASHAPFFNPSYHPTGLTGTYDPYAAANSSSSRDFVPWSGTDTTNHDLPLDPELKEERIRMLEHEFRMDAEAPAKEPVGSVDKKGRLVTDGPKKRVAVRVIETVLALGIAVSVVYAALVRCYPPSRVVLTSVLQWIKTPHPPPPQSEPHTFALYALSILTSLFLLYRFLFRPCCCGGRRKKRTLTGFGPGGLAVLPVQGLPGEKAKKKKGKKGKQERGDVQVNLIVDPTMFGSMRPGDEESATLDELSTSFSQTGSGRPKRRTIFEGLAIEEEWKAARKELKQMLFLDTICFLLWSVEFVWILIRERCPPGSFNGWCVGGRSWLRVKADIHLNRFGARCNAYNVASAGACFLGIVFGISVFFDVKDLHQSRASPRTRT